MKKLTMALLLCLASFFSYGEKIRLVIDAAHGGSDAGAVSATGEKESELNLQFAQALESYAKSKGIDVVMTRNNNEQEPTLDERTVTQTDAGTKTVLISFHTGVSTSKEMRGGSVIYSNTEGSKELAEKLTSALNRLNNVATKMEHKNIKVLRNSTVPAVSVSVGYISNNTDLKKLKDSGTQQELAMLIVKAITE
ncbi:MAG: N-acetylmuramoyl-L-alanine amidase [Bacteroidetes bacterium]|nr:N-acetylmuramoyl-L-alanine amidase [Bacteroidota bacterium]